MSLVQHAERELKLAGLFDKDSDYGGMLGHAMIRLIKVFAAERHSGASAGISRMLFAKLSNFENLTPITKDDWNDVSEMGGRKEATKFYQCKRNPELFSTDLETYYNVDKPEALFRIQEGKKK